MLPRIRFCMLAREDEDSNTGRGRLFIVTGWTIFGTVPCKTWTLTLGGIPQKRCHWRLAPRL